MKYPSVQSRTVLVTGCSSGIGLATALYLKNNGWQVFPTARKDADLAMLQEEGFTAIACDVADPPSVEKAVEATLAASSGQLGAVVNNAGIAQMGAVEDLSREALVRQFETNVFGPHELTHKLIPVFRSQGWGRIVNVSSVYGLIAAPMFGAYCASKYAMEALSDAMRIELRACGVAVSLIEPGPILTAFRKNAANHSTRNLDLSAGRYAQKYERKLSNVDQQMDTPKPFSKPPEAVARKILHAVESNRPRIRYTVTFPAQMAAILRRVLPPTWLDALLAKSARE